ncbi:MAG: NAD(P)H-hydrate epimerase [Candidatus Nanopelagicales bacterium]
MAVLPEGALMQRAAAGLAVVCAAELKSRVGQVTGSRVLLLVGAGDNGGDALYAGARLARRGARVDALLVDKRWHVRGAQALRAAGGRVQEVDDLIVAGEQIASTDLVLDAILGIGGRGGLREPAATLAGIAYATEVPVVAVDLPSGVDADTGWVEGAAVHAGRTVVLGVLKPGLLAGPGTSHAGELTVIDIGLDLRGAADLPGSVRLMTDSLAAQAIPRPGAADDKYTRGVLGITAGSATYPGAAILCTGAARHGAAGLVRYVGPVSGEVVRRWPDVVASEGSPAGAGRVQCWLAGPGRGTDEDARRAALEALASEVVVVLDADALTLLAGHDDVRAAVRTRLAPTVLTPHAGEFARLGGADPGRDRIGAVRGLAANLRAVVLLKGSATVVADPEGTTYVSNNAPPELATAGSGDVLSGIVGSLLAHAQAQSERHGTQLSDASAAALAAAAAYVHGLAGSVAASSGRPVAAVDVVAAVPAAVARLRAATGS